MGEVLARLGGAGRAREFRAFDAYARAVAHELVLLRAEILARLAAELGPNVVTEIRTRVGQVTPGA
jgi:hypothetical protein